MGIYPHARKPVLALAILAAHLAVVHMLLALRPPPPEKTAERPPVTVFMLPRIQDLGPALPGPATLTPNLTPPPTFSLPTPPVITPAAPDPGLTVLRQYLGCPLDSGLYTEDKERCAKMMRDLPVGPLPNLPPTEEEKALARKFERDQKALESPLMVPCLAGFMINPVCIAATLFGGGDFVTTYSETPARKRDPVATGMVGRSGRTTP